MKSKWQLYSSVFQFIVGILGIASFVILALKGEDIARWIVTLILSTAYVALGIIGIIDYKSKR